MSSGTGAQSSVVIHIQKDPGTLLAYTDKHCLQPFPEADSDVLEAIPNWQFCMLSFTFAKSQFTNIYAIYCIKFGLDAQQCSWSYFNYYFGCRSKLQAQIYLSANIVVDLHGHCQPENYVFWVPVFRIFPFLSLSVIFVIQAITFNNSMINVLRPTRRSHKIDNKRRYLKTILS